MKSRRNIYLKFTGIFLILMLFVAVYGYKRSQTSATDVAKPKQFPAMAISKPAEKKMAPGAACCKVSFSRTKMLSVKNADSSITPVGK